MKREQLKEIADLRNQFLDNQIKIVMDEVVPTVHLILDNKIQTNAKDGIYNLIFYLNSFLSNVSFFQHNPLSDKNIFFVKTRLEQIIKNYADENNLTVSKPKTSRENEDLYGLEWG